MAYEWNIIGRKNIFLGVSGTLVAVALFVVIFFGFRQGIDFTGGTLWQLRIPEGSNESLARAFGEDLKIEDVVITASPRDASFFVRLKDMPQADHVAGLALLKKKFTGLEELGFQSIGPSIGRELRDRAYLAIAFVLLGISLYIAFAFRKVSRPVSSWKYGAITLLTLFHDVAIPAGFLAFMGKYYGVEIDGNFIVALLVVMGFSVHDTIVVFDRIRENLSLDRGKTAFRIVVNQSVNQTLGRSVNTSLTLILVLLALIFVGPHALFYFILTLLLGVVTGIYSSIFVASPALLLFNRQGV